jgi:hypothetical protein
MNFLAHSLPLSQSNTKTQTDIVPHFIKPFNNSIHHNLLEHTFTARIVERERVKMRGEDLENRGGGGRGEVKSGRANNGSYPLPSPTNLIDDSETQWTSWLVPMFVVANIAVFLVVMYLNNCPKHNIPAGNCVAKFLGRFSFEPLKLNPLFGPSSAT